MSAVSGWWKMVIAHTSFFTIKTSPDNAISEVLFLWSHFELHSSNAQVFTQKLELKMKMENSVFWIVFCLYHSRKIRQMWGVFIPEGAKQLFTVRSYCKQWEHPPWIILWEKWRILPLLSAQWQLKTFLPEYSSFLIEKHSQQSKYIPLISLYRWEMGAQKF